MSDRKYLPGESETAQATQTLQEQAAHLIRRKIGEVKARTGDLRVIWWDDSGHLRGVIKEACGALDIGFTPAEDFILSLRKKALEEPKGLRVWYIPEGRKGRDWFLYIEETGGVIERNIQELAASLYEGIQSWDICQPDVDEKQLENIARILLEELTQKRLLPTFTQLKSDLITKGGGRPLEYILKNGWGKIDRHPNTVTQVIKLLRERKIEINYNDEIEEIVDKTRKHCVAQWLVSSGLDPQLLPASYRHIRAWEDRTLPLQNAIKSNSSSLDEIFLKEFWPEVISNVKDIWNLADCPVDGALERRLWHSWVDNLSDGSFDFCEKQAERRNQALLGVYNKNSAWVKIWRQAKHLASLAEKFETWENYLDENDLVDLYTDKYRGTWHIEKAVRHLIVTGDPESLLPNKHPAKKSLPELREGLLKREYLTYLGRLSEITIDSLNAGSIFTSHPHAYQFWNENREKLATGMSVAIFYIDALRFDLAKELAQRLREADYDVAENVYIGCLPSQTEFGMGALTPGKPYEFKILMENGELKARKKGRTLSTDGRKQLLIDEGWQITTDLENGWESPRVAYFDLEIDKYGENELDKIEAKISTRVEELYKLIQDRLERGGWQRIYIVTDHGFMLLPEGATIGGISPPNGVSEINRRWISGGKLENSYGVVINKNKSGMGYLDTKVKLLVDPFQRFRKQGISDSRYYHGGALPQEFILNFIEVTEK